MDQEQEFAGEYADAWVGIHFAIEVPRLEPRKASLVFPRFPAGFQFPSEGRNHPYDSMRVARAFKMRVLGHLGPHGHFGQNGRFERELIISEVLECREVLDDTRGEKVTCPPEPKESWWRRLFG
jgi:hypothetical protein